MDMITIMCFPTRLCRKFTEKMEKSLEWNLFQKNLFSMACQVTMEIFVFFCCLDPSKLVLAINLISDLDQELFLSYISSPFSIENEVKTALVIKKSQMSKPNQSPQKGHIANMCFHVDHFKCLYRGISYF